MPSRIIKLCSFKRGAAYQDVQDFIEPDLHAGREDLFLLFGAKTNVLASAIVVELLVQDAGVHALRVVLIAPALLSQEMAI